MKNMKIIAGLTLLVVFQNQILAIKIEAPKAPVIEDKKSYASDFFASDSNKNTRAAKFVQNLQERASSAYDYASKNTVFIGIFHISRKLQSPFEAVCKILSPIIATTLTYALW